MRRTLKDERSIVELLFGFVELARRQQWERAARLYAAHTAHCAAMNTALSPQERETQQEALLELQEALGPEYKAEMEQDRALSLEAAVVYALGAAS